MSLWIARLLPPLAVAVVIVTLDYARHTWWLPLNTWPAFLLAVFAAGAGAYILSEFLMRLFTRRYSTSVKIAAEIARLPSALERLVENTRAQWEVTAKQEILRQLANLADADVVAFFAAEANGAVASLDTTCGIREEVFPLSVPWDGRGEEGSPAPEPDEAINALRPVLWEAGFPSMAVLTLRSGGQAVGYLVLAGYRKVRNWLNWQEARDLVESQVGSILRNLELTSQGQVIATLRERDRIARELHDSLAQALTYIHMDAKAGLAAPCSDASSATRERLEAIAAAALEGYKDIRTTILDLRGEKAGEQDFLGLLEQYVQRFARDTSLSAEVVVEPGAVTEFPAAVEIQLLRVAQEALTNVRKHARARHVKVVFCNKPGAACVCVQDDGIGFERAQVLQRSRGFGLVSMRERLQEVGGKLVIESGPGLGTHIQARIPR